MQDQQIIEILSRHISAEENIQTILNNPDRNLFECGLDSMASFYMLDDLEQEGLHLEFTDFVASPTLTFLRKMSSL